MAPQVRLELTTLRLTAECSAIELLRIIASRALRASLPFPASPGRPPPGPVPAFCASASPPLSRFGSASRALPPLSSMLGSGKNFRFPRSLALDPGNVLLSQAVPSLVPSARGGLTSVFGMGTGGTLQLSSPETLPSLRVLPFRFALAHRALSLALRFRSASSSSLRSPRTFKTAQTKS